MSRSSLCNTYARRNGAKTTYLIFVLEFCMKRCIVRSCLVLLMVVVGETIPKFGKILSLVGGSTVTLTTFVLPPYFYMRLCDQKNIEWPERLVDFCTFDFVRFVEC